MAADHRQKSPQIKPAGLKTDRLDGARNLLAALLLGCVVATAGIIADAVLRTDRYAGGQVHALRVTGVSDLSLFPPGTRIGSPSSGHPAVDLRFTPFLPMAEPEPGELVIDTGQAGP